MKDSWKKKGTEENDYPGGKEKAEINRKWEKKQVENMRRWIAVQYLIISHISFCPDVTPYHSVLAEQALLSLPP